MDIEIFEETLRDTYDKNHPFVQRNNEYTFYYNCKDIAKIITLMIFFGGCIYIVFYTNSIQR